MNKRCILDNMLVILFGKSFCLISNLISSEFIERIIESSILEQFQYIFLVEVYYENIFQPFPIASM